MFLSRGVRLGVVISALWLGGFAIYTGTEIMASGEQVQNTYYERCMASETVPGDSLSYGTKDCFDEAYDDHMRHVRVAWRNAIPGALISLTLGWVLALLASLSYRWIMRGD